MSLISINGVADDPRPAATTSIGVRTTRVGNSRVISVSSANTVSTFPLGLRQSWGMRALFILACAASAAGQISNLTQALAQCGPICARAGKGGTGEPELYVLPPRYDEDWNLVLEYGTTKTGTSLLDGSGRLLTGSVYVIQGNNTAVRLENMTTLFTSSYYADDEVTLVPATTAWPAADHKFVGGSSTTPLILDWEQLTVLDKLTVCPDNVIVELVLMEANGNAVAGGTFYSPLFSWCYTSYNYPTITVTSPTSDNAGSSLPAQVVAGKTQVTVNWTATGVPWTQGFDIFFSGYTYQYVSVPSVDSASQLVTAATSVIGVDPSTPTSPLATIVAVNTNGDGTGVAYSATFTMPASAAGCTLFPIVSATAVGSNGKISEALQNLWGFGETYDQYNVYPSFANWGASDGYFFSLDPVSLNSSIRVTAPIYQQQYQLGDSLTLSWSGTNLLATDSLYLNIMNLDSGVNYYWFLGGSANAYDSWLTQDFYTGTTYPGALPIDASLNPSTTTSITIKLADNSGGAGNSNPTSSNAALAGITVPATTGVAKGYYLISDGMTPMKEGINYQASISINRPSYSLTGAGPYFKIVSPTTPVMSVSLSPTFPAVASWGQQVSLTYTISNFNSASPAISTIAADLWLSTLGRHDPSGDQNQTRIALATASSTAAASGTLSFTLPNDINLNLVDSSFFFVGVMAAEYAAVAAPSPYFSLKAPWVSITSPTNATISQCGTQLTITWAHFGQVGALRIDLYSLDATSQRDVFYATLTASTPASLGTYTVALPPQMTRGAYTLYAFNGATPTLSTASTKTPYFSLTCKSLFTMGDFSPGNVTGGVAYVAAGDIVTFNYTVVNLPFNSPLTFQLVNKRSGALISTLTTTETNKGYIEFPTEPSATYGGVAMKITDNTDPTSFALSSQTLTVVAPRQALSINALASTWVASKVNKLALSSTGFPKGAQCTVTFWAYYSEFSGPQVVNASITGRPFFCNTTSLSFTPSNLSSTLPYYYATVRELSTNISSRTEALALSGGTPPSGLSTLRSGGGTVPNASGASCVSMFSGSLGSWAAPALCANSCEACLAASGVWLVGVEHSLSLSFGSWAGTQGDQGAYARQLGAFDTKDTLCWPAPNSLAIGNSNPAPPSVAYMAAPGAANINATIELGALPWVQSRHAALNTGFDTGLINATLTVVAVTPGIFTRDRCDPAADTPVQISGLAMPSSMYGAGNGRVLQAATPTTPAVTVQDVCNAMIASMAGTTPSIAANAYTCAIKEVGMPVVTPPLPPGNAPTLVDPKYVTWDVVVVGGGAAGIAAAAAALGRGLTVLMIEGRDRLGGRVHTDRSWGVPQPPPSLKGAAPITGTIPIDLGAGVLRGYGVGSNPASTLVTRFTPPFTDISHAHNLTFDASAYGLAPQPLNTTSSAALTSLFTNFSASLASYIAALTTDVALSSAIEAVQGSLGLSPTDILRVNFAVATDIEQAYGADATQLSAQQYNNLGAFGGRDVVFQLGMDQLLTSLYSRDVATYAGNFSLVDRSIVFDIDTSGYGGGGAVKVSSRSTTPSAMLAVSTFNARSVIVTVPLGVLQNPRGATPPPITFTPPLPTNVTAIISGLGWGQQDKFIFEYDNGLGGSDSMDPTKWPATGPGDAFVFDVMGPSKSATPIPTYLNWQYVSRPAAADSVQFSKGVRADRYLMGIATGDAAVMLSSMQDDYSLFSMYVSPAIARLFPNITTPTRFKRSNWGADPLAYGAYSFNKASGTTSGQRGGLGLGSVTGCPGLLFAGEHVSTTAFGTVQGALATGTAAGNAIVPNAYNSKAGAMRSRRLAQTLPALQPGEVHTLLTPKDWVRHLAAHAPSPPALSRALKARAAQLSGALASGDLRHAMDMAKAGKGLLSRALVPAGEEHLLETWVSFEAPRVDVLAGTPSDTAPSGTPPIRKRIITLPDGRVLPLRSIGSHFTGGLPHSGLALPVQGFEHGGVFYADDAAHDCTPGEEGIGHWCVIAGAPPKYFHTLAEVARAGDVMREAGAKAYSQVHAPGTLPPPPSLAWTAADHHKSLEESELRRAGGERALSNAAASLSTFATPYTFNKMTPITGEGMTKGGFTGNRTTLLISVVWADYVWSDATSPNDPTLTSISDLYSAAADFQKVGLHTFGKLTPLITVSPCIYQLPAPFTSAYANDKATGPDSDSWIPAITAAATAAVKAGIAAAVNKSSLTACPPLDPATFHNFGIFQPFTTNCAWGGIAYAPGVVSLYNAQRKPNPTANIDNLAHLLWHEIGHNYGFMHSSTLPICIACTTTKMVEYGDYMTTHGSGPVPFFADFDPNEKHGAGWIDDAYVVNLARRKPTWMGTSAPPFFVSAKFDLAAYDREYTSYDAIGQLSEMPPSTALTARAAVPPSWTATSVEYKGDGFSRADPFFVYLGFYGANASWSRPYTPTLFNGKQISGPGIYLRSTYMSTRLTGHTLLTCYRDSTCTRELPLEPHDALVYQPEGIALLVQAGGFKTLFPQALNAADFNSPTQNSAIATTVTYLSWNGSSVDPDFPLTYTPTSVKAADPANSPQTVSGTLPGTIVFQFMPTSYANISITPSCSGAVGSAGADPSQVGLSFFVGSYPTAHAYYGGNVGYSGDGNAPSCTQGFLIQAGPDAPVWVVAAFRGAAKGDKTNTITVTLSYAAVVPTTAASIALTTVYHPTLFTIQGMCNSTNEANTPYWNEYKNNAFPSGGFTVDPKGCASDAVTYLKDPISGTSRFPGVTYSATCNPAYPVYTATTSTNMGGAVVYCASTYGSSTCTWVLDGVSNAGWGMASGAWVGEPVCFLQQAPQRIISQCSQGSPVVPVSSTQMVGGQESQTQAPFCGPGPCPVGQWSDTGLAAHCRCPLGWTYSAAASGSKCSGAHLGGPLAVAPTTAGRYENWASDTCLGKVITLFDGSLLANCIPQPMYPMVEADCLTATANDGTAKAYTDENAPLRCIWYWNRAAGEYQTTGDSGFTFTRAIDTNAHTVTWRANRAGGYTNPTGPQLAPNAGRPDFTAFCARNGTTMDWTGTTKACYCGPGQYVFNATGAGNSPICMDCAPGQYKGVGGLSGTGDHSRSEWCWACPTGMVSPGGAEACTASCPPGTALGSDPGSQQCLPSGPTTSSPSLSIGFACANPKDCAGSLQAIASSTSAAPGGARILHGRILAAGKASVAKFTAKLGKGSTTTGKTSGAAPGKVVAKKAAPVIPVPKAGKGVVAASGVAKSGVAAAAAAKFAAARAALPAVQVVILPSNPPTTSPKPTLPAKASLSSSATLPPPPLTRTPIVSRTFTFMVAPGTPTTSTSPSAVVNILPPSLPPTPTVAAGTSTSSATPSPTDTSPPSFTALPSANATGSAIPSGLATLTQTVTALPSASASPTRSGTASPLPTLSSSFTPLPTHTSCDTLTPTFTSPPTRSSVPTQSPPPTLPPAPTVSSLATLEATASAPSTPSAPPTASAPPTHSAHPTPSAPTLYSALGAFVLSSLPPSSFTGTTPTNATLSTLATLLTSSIAAGGCPTCTATITSVTEVSSGALLYHSTSLQSGGRRLQTSTSSPTGALSIGYRVVGSNTTQLASVSAASPSTTFTTTLASAVTTAFAGQGVTLSKVSTAADASLSPSAMPSPTPAATASSHASATKITSEPRPTASAILTASATLTASPTTTVSASPTPTLSPGASASNTGSISLSPTTTLTTSPTNSPTNSPTPSITPSPSATTSPTFTPSPTTSITPSPSSSTSPTPTPSLTPTTSHTAEPTGTGTPSGTPSKTTSRTPTSSLSPGSTPAVTPTTSRTPSPTGTGTPSGTQTPTVSPTGTVSGTTSVSLGASASHTPSDTPSITSSPTFTPTGTRTRTQTRSGTGALTPGVTPSITPSNSAYPSESMSNWPSPTNTPTPSTTPSAPGGTPSPTPSQTPSASPILDSTATLVFSLPMPDTTSPDILALFSVILLETMGLSLNTTSRVAPYSDATGSGFTFTFYIPVNTTVADGSGSGSGRRRRLATSASSLTDSLSALAAKRLTDGTLTQSLQQSGLSSALGYSDPAALLNGLSATAAIVVAPSPTQTMTTSSTPSPTPSPTSTLSPGSTPSRSPSPSPILPAQGGGGSSSSSSSSSSTLSGGAIAGAVIGSLAGFAILCVGFYYAFGGVAGPATPPPSSSALSTAKAPPAKLTLNVVNEADALSPKKAGDEMYDSLYGGSNPAGGAGPSQVVIRTTE